MTAGHFVQALDFDRAPYVLSSAVAATPSFKLVRSMDYRGGTQVWSNRYHLGTSVPANDSEWEDLIEAVVAFEKPIFNNNVTYLSGVCYLAGSDVPVYTSSLSGTGSATWTGGSPTPGDCASLIRYSTTQRTSKNHPIYLFNYYHSAYFTTGGAHDVLFSDQKAAMQTYAGHWVSGITATGKTYHRAGPNGAIATGYLVEDYITHRDFPR